jgi:hypothetical protein
MATLRERLADFICERYPEEEVPVEALCKDNKGTYVIPYACCRCEDEWRNFDTDETVVANVIGWRLLSEKRRYRALRKR